MRPSAKDIKTTRMKEFEKEASDAAYLAKGGLYPFETEHVGLLEHDVARPKDCDSQLEECTKKRHLLSETVRALTRDLNELKKGKKGGGRIKRTKKKRSKKKRSKKKRSKKKRSNK
jgi:hypothetical protein